MEERIHTTFAFLRRREAPTFIVPPRPTAMANLSQASEATLAKKLADMLAAPSMIYPNPVDTEIERRQLETLEDRDNFFVLKSAVGKTPEDLENVLKKLRHGATITKLRLQPVPGWSEDDPVFDFQGFSELVRKYLPQVNYFGAMHMLVKNFELKNLPQLQTVCLIDPQIQDGKWNLELANLEELIMENHTPPVKLFAQSIIQCPKIRRFFSHKYWAEQGSLPSLYLPNCEDFTLRRADCMSKISLYLPRVKILNLDADYDLKEITLLKRGHASHGEWNVPAEQQSDFCLSCENALLGKRAKESLKKSGRLLNEKALEDSDPGDCMGFPFGFPFGPPGAQDSEEEDDDEDDEDLTSLLGQMVRVLSLKSRKNLIGKEGKVIEIFPEKERVGVRFAHDESLELSIHIDNLEVLEEPAAKKFKKMREVN